jgi:NB-ARC domain
MELCLLPDTKPRRKVYVLCGLGGIGKTQLAVEFARRHQATFSSVFVIDGSSKDALFQSFMRVFQRVAVTGIDDAESDSGANSTTNLTPEKITAKALEWFSLEGNERWLLVFDNVDLEPTDPGGYALDVFFPVRDCGSIIVTTRLVSLSVAATVKRLKELNTTESMELLTETSARGDVINAGGDSRNGPHVQGMSIHELTEPC